MVSDECFFKDKEKLSNKRERVGKRIEKKYTKNQLIQMSIDKNWINGRIKELTNPETYSQNDEYKGAVMISRDIVESVFLDPRVSWWMDTAMIC